MYNSKTNQLYENKLAIAIISPFYYEDKISDHITSKTSQMLKCIVSYK